MCDTYNFFDFDDFDDDDSSLDTKMSPFGDGISTPSSSDIAKPPVGEYVPSVPCPGKIYKIHLKGTDKLITITEGEVVVRSPAEAQPGGGWYWVCVEKGNWLGFRNHVSGCYLGHDGKLGLWAKATQHKAHEYFCVRHHPDGGYVLLVKYPWGEELRQIGCTLWERKTLVQKEKDGAQWIFEEV